MSRYDSRDIAFDVPRHWEDRTMVAFSAPLRPGQATAPNLVMTHDALGPSETLLGYADRQIAEVRRAHASRAEVLLGAGAPREGGGDGTGR